MTAAPSPRPRAGSGGEAAAVILELAAGYLGQDGRGAGLLVRRGGRLHTAGCPFGQYLRPDDRLTHGSPCSDRCRQIAEAIAHAAAWLQAHESAPVAVSAPRQPALFEEVAG